MDRIVDSPYERPGQRVEVEGVELEEEERSMKRWCQVRRKSGQEEKGVATVTGMGGVQRKVPVPGPLLEIQAEREQGGEGKSGV